MHKSEKQIVLLFLLLIFATFVFFASEWKSKKAVEEFSSFYEKKQNAYKEAFSDVRLRAFSADVYSVRDDKSIFEKNGRSHTGLASLTKIMTTIIALETVPPDFIVTVRREDVSQEGDNGLIVGEKWKLFDLLQFMLLNSSNDAASAIAYSVGSQMSSNTQDFTRIFVLAMNKRAFQLGLKNTNFSNFAGLDIDTGSPGGKGTAHDIAKAFSYAFTKYSQIFRATTVFSEDFISESGYKHKVENTNTLISSFSNILASKTGFTDGSGGNLAIIFDAGQNDLFVIVVLGSTKEGRFTDTLNLTKRVELYRNLIN